jgi:hypothetical protein
VLRDCTFDAVQNSVRCELNGHVHEREHGARSRRPWRVLDRVKARVAAGPTAGRRSWRRLGGVDGVQRALMARQQWLAYHRSLGLLEHAHGQRRREKERRWGAGARVAGR